MTRLPSGTILTGSDFSAFANFFAQAENAKYGPGAKANHTSIRIGDPCVVVVGWTAEVRLLPIYETVSPPGYPSRTSFVAMIVLDRQKVGQLE